MGEVSKLKVLWVIILNFENVVIQKLNSRPEIKAQRSTSIRPKFRVYCIKNIRFANYKE